MVSYKYQVFRSSCQFIELLNLEFAYLNAVQGRNEERKKPYEDSTALSTAVSDEEIAKYANSTMYIIKALVLESIPDPVLTYYSKQPLARGNLITVPLRGKAVIAFVVSSTPIKETKLSVKHAGYALQPIMGVISEAPIISPRQKLFFERVALRYNIVLPLVLKYALPSPTKTFLHFPSVPIPKRFEGTLSQRLILVPTEAFINHVVTELGDQETIIYKKSLPAKEQRETWIRILSGDPVTVIGLSSALFLPWHSLSSIEIYDADNGLYKNISSPFFETHILVQELAKIHTSSLGDMMYHTTSKIVARQIEYSLIEDKKDPTRRMQRDLFSRLIQNLPQQELQQCNKIIILVNRCGYTPFVLCVSCGYMYRCPKCSVGLVSHENDASRAKRLICHHCRYVEKNPQDICPECHGFLTGFSGVGTEKVTEAFRWILPSHTFFAFDSDTAKTSKKEEAILKQFVESSRGVLVATELVFKHSLPQLDASLIIDTDRMLNIPDFGSEERVFRMIRTLGSSSKHVYICTRDSTRPIFGYINTPEKFFERESGARERYGYPPFVELTKIIYAHSSKESIESTMSTLTARMREFIVSNHFEALLEVSDPSPAFISKINRRFYYHILVRLKKGLTEITDEDLRTRNRLLSLVPRGFTVNIGASSIL
ncbi:MAG: hypothetical protein HZA36_00590 [Parcubacteria group bacterium]|nr:hypothetical protein [Parcubacteria group bacterium]